MSTEEPNGQPERTSLQQGIDWVAKHWPRLRLGHEGMMLDKMDRQNRIVEQLAKNTMTGDSSNTEDWPKNSGDDAMGVSIGDQVHHHYPPPTQVSEPTKDSGPSKLATLGVIAAALLAAGGIGAAVPWLAGAYDRPAASADNENTQQPVAYAPQRQVGDGIEIEVIPGGGIE